MKIVKILNKFLSDVYAVLTTRAEKIEPCHKSEIMDMPKEQRDIYTIYPTHDEIQQYYRENPPVYGKDYFGEMASNVIYFSNEIKICAGYFDVGVEEDDTPEGMLSRAEEEILLRESLGL